MLPRDIAQVDAETIRQLVDDKVQEGREIEYKRDLPGGSDAEKSEFLADVSSFANAAGGYLIFGVDEERDDTGRATGLPASVDGVVCPNPGAIQQRLDQLIQNGVGPRLLGVRFQWIEGFPRGSVLVMQIPQSWRPPHAITLHSTALKFFSRNSSGKRPLDIEELRGLFVSSELLPERLRSFHSARIGRLVAGEPPVQVTPGPTLVLHVLPLEAFRRDQGIPLAIIEKEAIGMSGPGHPPNSPCSLTRGLSGLTLSSSWSRPPVESYAHLFRNGCVEAALVLPPWRDSPTFPGHFLEDKITESVAGYLGYLRRIDLPPPVVLIMALLDASNLTIVRGNHFDAVSPCHSIGEETAVFPEVEIDDTDEPLPAKLKPLFDILWQASGWQGSPPRPPR